MVPEGIAAGQRLQIQLPALPGPTASESPCARSKSPTKQVGQASVEGEHESAGGNAGGNTGAEPLTITVPEGLIVIIIMYLRVQGHSKFTTKFYLIGF